MNKRAFVVMRSVVLPTLITLTGVYLHVQDRNVHTTVDSDPVQNVATITDVKDTKVAGTYLIVDFTDSEGRIDRTHVWYGWTSKAFYTGQPLEIYYANSNPLKAYAAGQSVSANLHVLETAVPVIYALSFAAAWAFFVITRRRKRVVAAAPPAGPQFQTSHAAPVQGSPAPPAADALYPPEWTQAHQQFQGQAQGQAHGHGQQPIPPAQPPVPLAQWPDAPSVSNHPQP